MSESVSVSDIASKQAESDLAQTEVASGNGITMPNRGKVLVAALCLYCLLIALIFHATLFSMVAIWLRSETFAHGFLILPISLWLAWRMQDRFADVAVRPEPRALVLILASGLAWLLANLVDVLVVQQLAFVAMLISGIWAITGNAVAKCYAFPLGFLFLAVPMGEGLIPPLMMITADTTEFLVRASGVSIYREGMYLYLPTATWSVIEACSGIRYLIASITLGLCYAHLNYTSMRRQLAFIALAIVAPILANSARAYVLVMVGHLSDMRLGIGAEHFAFGWLFFGAMLLLIFWIGGFWQQSEQAPDSDARSAKPVHSASAASLAIITCCAVLGAGAWSAASFAMSRNDGQIDTLALRTPDSGSHWQTVNRQDWEWRPAQQGADRELNQVYSSIDEPALVGLHLRQYLEQRQDVELVNNQSPLRPDRSVWRVFAQQRMTTDLGEGQSLQVDEARVTSPRENLLIWSWYQIDGRNTANPYLVKILEAKQQIFEGRRKGTRVFIATPLGQDKDQARQVLQSFMTDHLTAIAASLDDGIGAPLAEGAAQ